MKYLQSKSVKQRIHEGKKQITPDGLLALDIYVDKCLEKILSKLGSADKRVTELLVNIILK